MSWQLVLGLAAAGILMISLMLLWNAGLVCNRYDSRDRRALRGLLRWLALVTAIIGAAALAIAVVQSGWVLAPIVFIAGPIAGAIAMARAMRAGTAMLKNSLLFLSMIIVGVGVLLAITTVIVLASSSSGAQNVGALAVGILALIEVLLVALAGGLVIWLQYRAAREQSLLWLLAAAQEQGAPLHDAAHAFADENHDDHHARELSLYLQAGAPLPEALRRVGVSLPFDTRLAVDVGSRIELFGRCMRDVMGVATNIESLLRENVERLLYFMAVIMATMLVGVFLVLRIFPVIAKLGAEFGIGNMQVLDAMTDASPWLLALATISIATLSLVAYIGGLYYVDCLPINFIGIDLFTRRLDGSRLLRVLAASIAAGRPLANTLRILTLHFPRNAIRAKLFRTGQMVTDGRNWIDSLQANSLITNAECAVMKTAEKVGNLPWAMEGLAQMSAQRIAYRMRFWFAIVFPLIIFAAGFVYMFMAISLFIPLAALIEALS